MGNYNFEDCFTETSRGGARIYISDKFNYLPRKDFQIYMKGELKSVFVEVIHEKGPNIILGCIYRHPNIDLDTFNIIYSYLLERINTEKKTDHYHG